MMKFIRLDIKGEWRGIEHCSAFGDPVDYETMVFQEGEEFVETKAPTGKWESGISCYNLRTVSDAIEKLRWYWMDIAELKITSDYQNMQVTIFEGERLDGEGSDGEDMAVCTKTLLEIDAAPFMKKVIEAYDYYMYEDEDEDEEKYLQTLEEIFNDMAK